MLEHIMNDPYAKALERINRRIERYFTNAHRQIRAGKMTIAERTIWIGLYYLDCAEELEAAMDEAEQAEKEGFWP